MGFNSGFKGLKLADLITYYMKTRGHTSFPGAGFKPTIAVFERSVSVRLITHSHCQAD